MRVSTLEYQRVRNVSVLENLAYVLNGCDQCKITQK